jgi:hypothetical protein
MRGTTAAPNKEEIRRNMRAVAHAIAQQELEGLEVPESTIADLERVALGNSTRTILSAPFTAGSRMTKYSGRDDYLDPASGVLKNRFGITDAATLERTEATIVFGSLLRTRPNATPRQL